MPLVVRQKKNSGNKKKQKDTDADYGMLFDENDTAVVHEVKRVGLLIDRYVDMELRIGDHLIIYISKNQTSE